MVTLPQGQKLVKFTKYVGVYNRGERAVLPEARVLDLMKAGAVEVLDPSVLPGAAKAEDEEGNAPGKKPSMKSQ